MKKYLVQYREVREVSIKAESEDEAMEIVVAEFDNDGHEQIDFEIIEIYEE